MGFTHKNTRIFYQFDRYCFYPDERRLLQDGSKQLWLDPKPNALLRVLVQDGGKLITYDELKQEVWPEMQHIADRTLHQHKYALAQVLGKNSKEEDYIETVSGKGYRFAVEVLGPQEENLEDFISENSITDVEQSPAATLEPVVPLPVVSDPPNENSTSKLNTLFGGHIPHIVVSCSLYSILYAVALFIEVAYHYERFGSSAWVIAFVILIWIMGTSLIGLWADWRWTAEGKKTGLLLSLSSLIVGGLFVYLALGYYLPNQPITEARFQTYPAHGAYLKSVYYYLPLAAICLILPFHFVISLNREIERGNRLVQNLLLGKQPATVPAGAIFLRPWMLGPLLFGAAVYALVATAHLFDNLIPRTYTSVFMQLVQLRLLLYFALGLECLLWYSWTMNEIKRELVERWEAQPRGSPNIPTRPLA
jgi:DNA-binding winged helix-turn-helix (wHTH) protein/uncharacterized membrane protein